MAAIRPNDPGIKPPLFTAYSEQCFHPRSGSQPQPIPRISQLFFLDSLLNLFFFILIKPSNLAVELPLFTMNSGQFGTETGHLSGGQAL